MNKSQIQAAVDYINDNAAQLHGVEKKDLDVDGDIKIDDVVTSRVDGTDVVLVVNRDTKGTPKYRIPAADIEAWAEQQKLSAKAKKAVSTLAAEEK